MTNILLVGVGGQGTVLAGKLLAQVALQLDLDVKVSEIHGMSQRGGSVVTQVRIGPRVYSPVIARGTAGAVVAFEKLEALRWLPYLAPEGKLIVNDQSIDPLPVITGAAEYPADVLDRIRQAVPNATVVKALDIALSYDNPRGVNMVLLGILARHLDIEPEVWMEALARVVKPQTLESNRKAFQAGLALA
ncbi:indolepyruvate oxidoreductase subunit beta [Clostridiales bacterium PH28_bin88]|nr:indolepyruvate oxidoreductase subunit beta [Clostridiales bacterium PH28_bin88]